MKLKYPEINWQKYKSPITFNINNWKSIEDKEIQLYQKQLEGIRNKFEEYESYSSKTSDKKLSVKDLPVKNIAITGERGTGKTSLINSLAKLLKKENYYVFDNITSTLLETKIRIFEVVLAQIYNRISESSNTDVTIKTQLIGKIKKIIQALEVESDVNKLDYKPSIEKLTQLRERANLDELFKDLLTLFKVFIKTEDNIEYKDFVIVLDDLDLSINQDMLNDIQRYLSGQVIIIFGYNEELMLQSLVNTKLSEFKDGIANKITTVDEVRTLCENILLKLIPKGNRFRLFDQQALLSQNVIKVLPKELIGTRLPEEDLIYFSSVDNEQTVEEWFYDFIYRNTNLKIKPIDTKEDTGSFLPKTLREFYQCCEIFHKMTPFVKRPNEIVEAPKISEAPKIFKNNLIFLQEYFNHYWGVFGKEEQRFVQEWNLASSYKKNYLTFHFFYRQLDEKQLSNGSYYFNKLKYVEEYNITLGDVYDVMEATKISDNSTIDKRAFIYYVKVFYSIELSRLLYEGYEFYCDNKEKSDNDNNINLFSYLQLINANFMPTQMNYFEYTKEYSENSYILLLTKSKEWEWVKAYLNSDVAAGGDIRKVIYSGVSSLRYRFLYKFENGELDLKDNHQYFFHFFLPPTKMDHVKKFYEGLKVNSAEEYIFFNLFHIDVFIRQNYARRTEDNPIEYVLKQIKKMLSGEEKGEKKFIFEGNTCREDLESNFLTTAYYAELYENYKDDANNLKNLRDPKNNDARKTSSVQGNIQEVIKELLKKGRVTKVDVENTVVDGFNSKVPEEYRYEINKGLGKLEIDLFIDKVLKIFRQKNKMTRIAEIENLKGLKSRFRKFCSVLLIILEDLANE